MLISSMGNAFFADFGAAKKKPAKKPVKKPALKKKVAAKKALPTAAKAAAVAATAAATTPAFVKVDKATAKRLQAALVTLGKIAGSATLKAIKVDGALGPKTASAVNLTFTKHIGPGQAPAQYRTGRLTLNEVKANAGVLAGLIETEIKRRGGLPAPAAVVAKTQPKKAKTKAAAVAAAKKTVAAKKKATKAVATAKLKKTQAETKRKQAEAAKRLANAARARGDKKTAAAYDKQAADFTAEAKTDEREAVASAQEASAADSEAQTQAAVAQEAAAAVATEAAAPVPGAEPTAVAPTPEAISPSLTPPPEPIPGTIPGGEQVMVPSGSEGFFAQNKVAILVIGGAVLAGLGYLATRKKPSLRPAGMRPTGAMSGARYRRYRGRR